MTTEAIRYDNVRRTFGGLAAVSGVSLSIGQTEGIVALIGPNGAGKSTLFDITCGLQAASSGSVHVRGRKVDARHPYALAEQGVARTFQNFRLIEDATCLQNVRYGTLRWARTGAITGALRTPGYRREEREIDIVAEECLEFVGLADRGDTTVSQLPAGARRLVEMARARAAKASIYIFDEPAGGLNDAECSQLRQCLLSLVQDGSLILLVEHRVSLVMSTASRILVMNEGRIIADGTPHDIRNDPAVIEAYLGGGDHAGHS